MLDLIQQAGLDIWVVLDAAVFVVVFMTGMKMRLLWLLLPLIGAGISLVLAEPSRANVEAWRWFAIPFVLFPVVAGWQNRSPLLPLLVAIIGGGLSGIAFFLANAAT
jgi:hypothetical protein